jgi:hypothetical protein
MCSLLPFQTAANVTIGRGWGQRNFGGRFSSLRAAHSVDATQGRVSKVDLVDINTDEVSLRTKKVDMTPIRLEGDDDDEEDSGDGDSGIDDDEDEESSTPVPRSKRHVARCVFPFYFTLYLRKFSSLLTTNYKCAIQKNYCSKACSSENKIPKKRLGQGARR